MNRFRRTAVAAALCASGLLASCASMSPQRDVPAPGFAIALRNGLPSALGVYGVTRRSGLPTEEIPVDDAGAVAPEMGNDDDDVEDRTLMRARVGAGFAIDATGLAVTAAHVVADCERIVVRLADQRVVVAEKIADDPETDIALVRLPVATAAPPVFGNAAALRAGDGVLAVGDPYGLNRTVTAGIVGGMDRHFAEDEELLYIQSDIALNPGNSGGPLIDALGAIVGMNMRTVVGAYGTPGVSLSIPIDVVLQIAEELKGGTIRRPRLGAHFNDVSAPAADLRGRSHASDALVALVHRGSLAERFGLKVGDIVVSMNGRAIGRGADLARALLAWRDAASTRFTVFRAGGYRELRLE